MNRHQRAGFTLMEIMVVIIVIAVLASVAGPMIGSITDQGKTAATKANMNNIKTALVNFNNDLGRFPFLGANSKDYANYNSASNVALGNSEDLNVLVNNEVSSTNGYENLGMTASQYNKRWKGPYMDAAPDAFIYDAWDNQIQYFVTNKQLYLQSPGADGVWDWPACADSTVNAAASTYEGDDILVPVTRLK